MSLDEDSEGEHRALFTYRCEESALIFLLSRHNVELLCRRSRPLNTQLAMLARDWLRHQFAILSNATRIGSVDSTSGDSNAVSRATTKKQKTPQQRIAQCVARLEAQAKRLEETRLLPPARRGSGIVEEESPEEEERRQLIALYLAGRVSLLRPIVPGAQLKVII